MTEELEVRKERGERGPFIHDSPDIRPSYLHFTSDIFSTEAHYWLGQLQVGLFQSFASFCGVHVSLNLFADVWQP
jgi:hypothetical protein